MDLTKILPSYAPKKITTPVTPKEVKFEQLEFNFDEPEELDVTLSARQELVLNYLSGFPQGATAKELSLHLHSRGLVPSSERNSVHPRLNELIHLGLVKTVGKKTCVYTNRKVSIYKSK